MKRTIGYLRVSTDKQLDGHSVDNQDDKIRQYCQMHDFELIEVLEDRGLSGRKSEKRPGFQKMMAMVENGEVDNVVVLSFSRFARNTVDTISSIDRMIKNGVAFHSITESINTAGAAGKFFTTVLAALAQFESDQLSERVTSTKRFCKSNGRTYTKPVYGYDNKFQVDSNGKRSQGRLVPNEKELQIVDAIFGMKDAGYSLRQICSVLNEEGSLTKTGKLWHANGIKQVLDNSIHQQFKKAA